MDPLLEFIVLGIALAFLAYAFRTRRAAAVPACPGGKPDYPPKP